LVAHNLYRLWASLSLDLVAGCAPVPAARSGQRIDGQTLDKPHRINLGTELCLTLRDGSAIKSRLWGLTRDRELDLATKTHSSQLAPFDQVTKLNAPGSSDPSMIAGVTIPATRFGFSAVIGAPVGQMAHGFSKTPEVELQLESCSSAVGIFYSDGQPTNAAAAR